MKKVLIIAYAFPPHPAIASQRPFRLAKYFPQYGWEPVVLTVKRESRPPDGIKVIESEHNDLFSMINTRIGFNSSDSSIVRPGTTDVLNSTHSTWKSNLVKLFKEVIYYPDRQKSWYKTAVKSASEYLSKEKVHAIISTSTPVTDHLIAKKLKQRYKIPWIADFRDPWSQNTYDDKFTIIKHFEQKLELKTLSFADAIVTVTEPWIDLLASLHKGKKIHCVTNGYDNDEFANISTKLTDKLTISYTGGLYKGKRDPSMFFQVLNNLISSNKINRDIIEVRFLGHSIDWLIHLIDKYALTNVVKIYGFVPREETLRLQKESQLLLLLLWNNKGDESVIPGKIFEYIASKRPIIAVGASRGAVHDLLYKTNAGKITNNSDELENFLLQFYSEFINTGKIQCTSNNNTLQFEYKSITKKYSKILDEILL